MPKVTDDSDSDTDARRSPFDWMSLAELATKDMRSDNLICHDLNQYWPGLRLEYNLEDYYRITPSPSRILMCHSPFDWMNLQVRVAKLASVPGRRYHAV
jgi:hypothetical protein